MKNFALAFLTFAALATTVFSSSAEILAAHNKYRREVQVPDLVWDRKLENDARRWAPQIAKLGRLQYERGTGQGENQFYGTSGAFSFTQIVDNWGSEKRNFKYGKLPYVSIEGRPVGHYTQIIWRKTRKVGCAGVNRKGMFYFVCRYLPPGNYRGQYPY